MELLDPSQWVDKYTDYLYSYAFFKTGKKEEAEDLVQETFLSAFKNKQSFKGNSSEKTWLTRILKNKIIDYYRKTRPEQSLNDYVESTNESFEKKFFTSDEYGHWKMDIDPNYISESPESYLAGKEFRKFLEVCLMKLPQRLRAVFIAKFIDDEKPEDICKENDITSSNYWVMIFRAKVLMRDCLEKKGVA
jgi:RNA polymerase sigma-70 factor (TIGR02943 family)